MGRLFLTSLPATGAIYRCKHCAAHLAYAADIISKMFRCKHGRAYLFDRVANVNVGESDERMMTTGLHTVCDIFCVGCGSILGWKYVAAFDNSQRYKEGKFILERRKVLGAAATASASASPSPSPSAGGNGAQMSAELDAQASDNDEDEHVAM